MAAAPTRWTDERHDDAADRLTRFEGNVDARFDKVDRRFDRFDSDVDARFAKVDRRFDKVDERFDRLEATMRIGFAELSKENKVSSKKVSALLLAVNVAVWGTVIAAGVVKLLFG
jgi:hypothetical protein